MYQSATGENYSIRKMLRDWLFTIVFCLVIGVILALVAEGENLLVYCFVSLGYGVSVQLSITLFSHTFSHAPRWLQIILPLLVGLLLGTLFAQQIFNGHSGLESAQSKALPYTFGVGLVFSVIAIYLLTAQDKRDQIQNALRLEQLQTAEQEKQLSQSQLKILQSQIEPHFLFNTLATIQVLIESNPKQASKMLQNLTDLLRTSLAQSRLEVTTLQQELTLITAYLEIQQIRLGKRLKFRIEPPETSLLTTPFPALLLQPLVENALIHGIEPNPDGGELTVKVILVNKRYQIIITDTGIGLNESHRTENHPKLERGLGLEEGLGREKGTEMGMGLENIRARLNRLHGQKASLTLQENKPSGVICTLEIPLE